MTAWYAKHLKYLGLSLMFFGFSFFLVVYPTGAPAVPWAGLVLAFLGAWLGFSGTNKAQVAKPEKPE